SAIQGQMPDAVLRSAPRVTVSLITNIACAPDISNSSNNSNSMDSNGPSSDPAYILLIGFFAVWSLVVVAVLACSVVAYRRRLTRQKTALAFIESTRHANLDNAASLNQQPQPEGSQQSQQSMYATPPFPSAAFPSAPAETSTTDMMRILIATERQRDPIGTAGKTDDEVASVLLARR
ncbi:hypothetical protein BC831DRAFT_439605, partial [Entophlyctis helioformis]